MEEVNKSKDSIDPVGIEGTKKILDQLMNCICKMKIKGGFGTGFFCKIPFRKGTKKVLMTNYHILNEKDFKENKVLNLTLNNDKETLIIDLEINREIYFNKEYDITILEIREKDNIKDYLELDDNLFQDNIEINYKNESIYILHYLSEKEAKASYGLLNNINKYIIDHNCSVDNGSCGAPILNLQNNKVIGIHNKGSKNYNIGTLLKFPLKEFINRKEKMSININKKEYMIIKELENGGFGKAYQVLNKLDNKNYAIKVIPIKDESKEKIKSFEKEAVILFKFNCDNIIKYYDYEKYNNNIYILKEFCWGDDLRSFINKYINDNTLIEENILINIIKQLCIGIKEIHDKKIIHRDLKPENIFINENMNIKIGDFGISKQFESYKAQIKKNKFGKNDYVAPEILNNEIYNEKSDIWSLGCILYELFNLSIYFKDKLFDEIKKINSDIYNNKWQILIDSLLQPDYKKRFDINQVIQFLENELNNNDNIKKNIIIGEIYIKKEDLNKNIRIINSYENLKREGKLEDSVDDWKYENEKEIKENIEIKLNGKIIEFTYYFRFNKEGKYIIEYSFKNNLTKTCYMFNGCKSLKNLNLSNFNTQNVTNMSGMFFGCKSLANLNLTNFNTQNVTDMSSMFYDCKSIANLDLSNFNTQNVTDMSSMFFGCKSFTNLNLSNFNTQNVTKMNNMFYDCISLRNINLSNFNTQNVTEMNGMFFGCYSLKKENIITKDNNILNQLK